MSERRARPDGAELLEVRRLRLVEEAAPRLSAEQRLAVDRAWAVSVGANPSLFDGPLVGCTGLAREGADGLVVTWVRTSFRHYALRLAPDADHWLPSLYVCVVQPTDDGRLLVGRTAASAASPGTWQLPGGSAEPPPGRAPLDRAALARHAALELAEETGRTVPPGDLALRSVAHDRNGNVGVLFRAPPQPAARLRKRFAAVVAAETAHGREPELDRIALVRSEAELTGPRVPYLAPVLQQYARRSGTP